MMLCLCLAIPSTLNPLSPNPLSAWQTDISFFFFQSFFLMCTTFKVLIKFVTILFLFYVLVFFTKMYFGYGLPRWLNGKESACNAGDLCFIYGLGRSPGGENGNPLQYSCLENPIDRGAWWATIHGVEKESHMTKHACIWDLSSLTRDWTCTPCTGSWNLNHWTAKEVPLFQNSFHTSYLAWCPSMYNTLSVLMAFLLAFIWTFATLDCGGLLHRIVSSSKERTAPSCLSFWDLVCIAVGVDAQCRCSINTRLKEWKKNISVQENSWSNRERTLISSRSHRNN